jgi:hypothetical protein
MKNAVALYVEPLSLNARQKRPTRDRVRNHRVSSCVVQFAVANIPSRQVDPLVCEFYIDQRFARSIEVHDPCRGRDEFANVKTESSERASQTRQCRIQHRLDCSRRPAIPQVVDQPISADRKGVDRQSSEQVPTDRSRQRARPNDYVAERQLRWSEKPDDKPHPTTLGHMAHILGTWLHPFIFYLHACRNRCHKIFASQPREASRLNPNGKDRCDDADGEVLLQCSGSSGRRRHSGSSGEPPRFLCPRCGINSRRHPRDGQLIRELTSSRSRSKLGKHLLNA